MAAKRTLILGVTGSIAAYKTADLASKLKKLSHDVFCVMTKDATQFITPLTLQTMSQHPVTLDLFEEGEGDWRPSHLQLADTAARSSSAAATRPCASSHPRARRCAAPWSYNGARACGLKANLHCRSGSGSASTQERRSRPRAAIAAAR